MPVHPALSLLPWLCLAGPLAADTLYKSVDAEGRVTYSSQPPLGAVRTEPLPLPDDEPSEAERQDALRRADETGARLDELAREREELQQRQSADQQGINEALQARDAARTRLEESRIQRDEDWQATAKGGRFLKDGYFQRVQEAEQALQAAEVALDKARRDARR